MTDLTLTTIAQIIDEAQAKENNGRGVSCVRSIVHYLRNGDLDSARAVHLTDGDKIRNYPKLSKLLIDSLHGQCSCCN